ncbi:aromatase/cyclase [Amycolatopsis sp. NPDC054798]
MLTHTRHTTEERIRVAAPAGVVRGLITDVEGWVQLHPPAVHAEVLCRDQEGDLVQQWTLAGDDEVRVRRLRRRLYDEDRITFAHQPAEPPFAEAGGGWIIEPQSDGGTVVRMYHEFALSEPDEELAATSLAAMRRGAAGYLATLKYAAEHRDELQELTVSFDDPLFVAGSVEDAYAYLYEADKWPGRIPHVTRLDMTEKVENIQFFDMDTLSADGSRHATRSVRVCLPRRKIGYKQIQPPKTMTAHTGHWAFTETREGVVVTSRHTATIRPDGLHLLGEGMTVEGARRYLRRVLSANSTGNLRLTKEYAEKLAGF